MLKFQANFPPKLVAALVVLLASLQFKPCHGIDFHRNTTGMAFSAYVRKNQTQEEWNTYTLNELKTMIKVMSTKVSRITTFGVGALDAPYKWNETYHKSNGQIYSAQAAALVNREMSRSGQNPPVTMILGIWQHNSEQQVETEMLLAVESANKSNLIFPGTVQGLVLSGDAMDSNLDQCRKTLEQLKRLHPEAEKLRLKLGTRQSCTGMRSEARDDGEMLGIRKEIVKLSDFIICEVGPQTGFDSRAAFAGVQTKLLKLVKEMKHLNPNIEVMGQTGFPGKATLTHEVENLRDYWQSADEWAAQNKFTLWMLEAFDNPWKNEAAAHFGWWKLKDNSQTGSTEGYEEKAVNIKDRSSTTQRPSNNGNSNTRSKSEKKNGAGKMNSVNYYMITLEILAVTVLTMSRQ